MKRYTTLLASLLLISSYACKENIDDITEGIAKRDYTLVQTAPIKRTNNPIPVNAIGRVSSDKEVRLSFKIGGIISAINADEGDYVKKGSLLATIRTNEIDAQVLKAERALTKVQRDLERVTNMFNDEAATLENVQDLQTLLEVSQADLDIAKFNQRYARIISPISGRVLRRNAEPNELVSPGMPIFIVTNSSGSNYIMKAALSDKDVNRINYGDRVSMSFDAYPDHSFGGSISQIAESADPRTGTFDVDIAIKNNRKRLRNGNIGRVVIAPKSSESFYRIPIDAMVETADGAIVLFSPEQGDTTAMEWRAKPVHIDDDFVLVELAGGGYPDRVITAGAPYLIDGDKIRVVNNLAENGKEESSKNSSKYPNRSRADNSCMIILGAYSIQHNIDRMIAKLDRRGYDSFTRPFRSLTQVGIRVPCDPRDYEETLKDIRSSYAADAVFLTK